REFGIDLPSLNNVAGDPVTWTVQPIGASGTLLAKVTKQDLALGSDHSANLSYLTQQESADQAARGALITTDYMKVTATVTPLIFNKLLKLVNDLTLGRLPGAVTKVVGPIVKALSSAIVKKITALVAPSDFRSIQITHHGSPPALGHVS